MNSDRTEKNRIARFRDAFVAETDRWRGLIRMIVRGRLKELQAVAPWVLGVETADARERDVVGDFYAAGEESLAQVVEVVDSESGMGLPCGAEIRFDADMELLVTAFEPATASDA